jgi:predicted nuclease of restriction endonuclease-like (RecB) superfamily
MSTKHNMTALSPYEPLFTELKLSVRRAQVKAGMAINRDLILLYWQIGKAILNQQREGTWDAELIDRVSSNLRAEFPEVSGFSKRNLKYMQAFASLYSDYLIVQAGPALITWQHNCVLLDKVQDPNERHWYTQQVIASGWSCEELLAQIESKFYKAQENHATAFSNSLAKPQSELTQQMLLDSHNLEFLTLAPETQRRYFQNNFLREVKEYFASQGRNLALLGGQYQLLFNDQDYFVDFLFYHLKLRCFVIVNLEIEDYCTSQLKKMCEHLDVANETLKHETDNFSIGLVLCRTPTTTTAKYILREDDPPYNVVQIDCRQNLPTRLQEHLPTLELLLKRQ